MAWANTSAFSRITGSRRRVRVSSEAAKSGVMISASLAFNCSNCHVRSIESPDGAFSVSAIVRLRGALGQPDVYAKSRKDDIPNRSIVLVVDKTRHIRTLGLIAGGPSGDCAGRPRSRSPRSELIGRA